MARPAGSAALKRRLMRNLQRHTTMHLWGERFEAIQQSRVHCNLSIGHWVAFRRSPGWAIARMLSPEELPKQNVSWKH